MSSALRILDANANRAREALRVLEDIARFHLDRGDLVERLKVVRHGVAHAVELAEPDALRRLAARDTAGDVGTAVTAVGEYARAGLPDLVAANAARLSEALRAAEESAKALARPEAAAALERARYAAYDLERDLRFALGAARRQWRLCLLLTASLCVRPWLEVASLAIDAGADAVQLREKSLPDADLLARARALVGLARPRGVAVVINDRPDVAVLANADALHLGQTDLAVRDARRIVGSMPIGVSTSSLDTARRARDDGADSIGIGPMFTTSTKPKEVIPGPGLLREVLADASMKDLPHLAIGGISPANVRALVEAGARGVAASSAICAAADPGAATAAILAAWPASTRG